MGGGSGGLIKIITSGGSGAGYGGGIGGGIGLYIIINHHKYYRLVVFLFCFFS